MALFVFVVSSIVWLGAGFVRALIGNDILTTSTTDIRFDDTLDPRAEREAYRLIAIASVAGGIGYLVALTSAIAFLLVSPFSLKTEGWLLMSVILFFAFVPVELYTLHLDWKIISLEFYTTADIHAFRPLFIARIKALAGMPFIAQLCYYTIIALAVFQPFKKPQRQQAERSEASSC
jgi:hypothetical protein